MTAIADWQPLHGDDYKAHRVLVTGAAGFIGSHLCEALVTLGAHVVALDDLSSGARANLEAAGRLAQDRGGLEFVEGSILDVSTLARCTEGCFLVFHQAALASVPRSIEQPVPFSQVNVTGTLNVLEAARQAKVKRVIFAASSSAYGDSPVLPKVETMVPRPKSPYAANKLAGEYLMLAYADCYDLDTVSLRYFNIFGPRQTTNEYSGVIAIFARQLMNGQPVTIFGEGCSRDFTYVDNVVHANLLAGRSQRPVGGEVINVACGGRVTIRELALKMAELLGITGLEPIQRPPRPGDVEHSLADVACGRDAIGYQPIVGFEIGLKATVDWYRNARP